MSINIRTDFMQHAELFGNPVLFTNWLIQRDTIPKDWYCYDLRGTRQSPNVKIALVDKTARYHAGTVLSPTPLKRKETASRRVNSAFHLLGEEMTLEQFCEEHSLEYPQDDRKFTIKAASFDEAALFYAMTPEEDQRLGCIGHVRMDFGHRGQEFWHTWWPRGPEELNSPEFKAELQEVVDELRTSVLKDLAGMTKYCWGHGGEVGGWPANYGYIVETENYRYAELMAREKYPDLPSELFQTPQAAQIGRTMLEEGNGAITEYGLIRRTDGRPLPVFTGKPQREEFAGPQMTGM